MEPAEHYVGDENMGVWVGVLGVDRGKRCEPIQETCNGKLDSLSGEIAYCTIVVHSVCLARPRGYLVPSINKRK